MYSAYRSEAGQKTYNEVAETRKGETGCKFCTEEPIKEFTHWKILPALFPYDLITTKHDLILTKRHVDEFGLNEEEKKELLDLKYGYITENYEYILEPVSTGKSVPSHFHLHLIVAKRPKE